MGWGRYLLLGDFGQQLDLADQKTDMLRMREKLLSYRRKNASLENQVEQLQNDNDELRLYLASLVRLLVGKSLVSSDELSQMIVAVDASDGLVDGKFTGDLHEPS